MSERPMTTTEKPWSRNPSIYQTYCFYCQRDHGTLAKLKRHLLAEHPGTYAAHFIAEERDPE
jgi:hypothetical protein